jgi:26S proteasome regulatory subunit T5
MVANVGEILDADDDNEDEKDSSGFTQANKTKKSLVVKTTGRHTIYLPVIGMVEPEELKPGELIAVNKESFIVYEKLPPEYDSRVKAMEIDERPTEEYSDIGGLDKQIQELIEAIVLPMTHKERFDNIGIRPPKGLLLHGPPGTGKTMMARACAAQTKATFLKLAGP